MVPTIIGPAGDVLLSDITDDDSSYGTASEGDSYDSDGSYVLGQDEEDDVNPSAAFAGMEEAMIPGIVPVFPKPVSGLTPSAGCSSIWWHMRGFGSGADRWPKSDKIESNYTSTNALRSGPLSLLPSYHLRGLQKL